MTTPHVIIAATQHTAAEVIAVFHRDMTAGVIAAVLITMGIGMLLLGGLTAGRSRRSFVYTGLFAIAYGTRLAINAASWSLVRIGALVFAAFVLNEHFHFVDYRYGITREPTGFLILMLTIIITTMRHATQSQQRLAASIASWPPRAKSSWPHCRERIPNYPASK